jgi:hypothetical protein
VLTGEDKAIGIGLDTAGNSYVTGYSKNGGSYYDWITVKYDSNGNRLWHKVYDGPAKKYDTPAAIRVDRSGNVYVTGSIAVNSTTSDIATIKYDTNGNILWSKT